MTQTEQPISHATSRYGPRIFLLFLKAILATIYVFGADVLLHMGIIRDYGWLFFAVVVLLIFVPLSPWRVKLILVLLIATFAFPAFGYLVHPVPDWSLDLMKVLVACAGLVWLSGIYARRGQVA